MVHFGSYSIKNVVMESLFKLKHAEQKFKSIIVTHDMTQKERDQCKNVVEEAKQKESHDTSGEYKYRVRGPPGNMIIKNTPQAVKNNKDVPDAVKCNRNLNVVYTNAVHVQRAAVSYYLSFTCQAVIDVYSARV